MRHSKILLSAIAATLTFSVSAVQAMVPGTYEGSALGHNGPITVKVTVDAQRILNVEVVKATETRGIGDIALQRLPQEVLQTQRVQVDTVSAATITSFAFRTAVSEALEKAKANQTILEAAPVHQPAAAANFPTKADVIVVGAGGAGLVAAATAAGEGAKVIVLEKMPMVGGNTVRSEGRMSAIDPDPSKLQPMTPELKAIVEKVLATKVPAGKIQALQDKVKQQYADYLKSGQKQIFDTPEFYALQTLAGGDYKADPDLVLTMAKHSTEAMEWLDAQSDNTWYHLPRHYIDMGIGALYPRAQVPAGKDGKSPVATYDLYIEPLVKEVKAKGSTILTNMQATELVQKDGRVVAVKALNKADGKTYVFHADKGVVLAAGGYGANLEMVAKYNGVQVTATSNQPGTTGEMIEAAVKDGAALTGMQWIQLIPHANPKTGELESNLAGRPQDTPYVNQDGLRFVDETGRRDTISQAVLKQKGKVFYSIYDQRTLDSGKVRPESMTAALYHQYAYKANTIAELAKLAGINEQNLEKTLTAYNKAAAVQNDKGLPVNKSVFGWAVEKAPFYAIPLTVNIHYTMGGLKINENAQVINKDGKPIAGLYAAGEITGGIHGANRLGRNALTDLLVFGHIAGQRVLGK